MPHGRTGNPLMKPTFEEFSFPNPLFCPCCFLPSFLPHNKEMVNYGRHCKK